MGEIKSRSLTARVLATLGLLGSVQVLALLCSVVRTKLVALWVGTAGVGVLGLLVSAVNLFKTVCTLNLGVSTVPSLSAAKGSGKEALGHTVMRLGGVLGLVGMVVMCALSPLLSKLSFDTYSYTWSFALLAPVVLLTTSAEARTAVLQGAGRLHFLGKANLAGIALATAVSLPLVYFFRTDALVPMILIYAACPLIFICCGTPVVSLRRTMPEEQERSLMVHYVSQGAAFTIAAATGFAAEYLLRAWLSNVADMTTAGLFQAGAVIIGSYLGMAFTAITMEFYPRLSTTIASSMRTRVVMGHELSLLSRLMLPAVLVFMAADELVVKILYSSDFEPVCPYLTWAAAGTLARGAAWCMSFAILARGDSRAYLVTESISAAALLGCSYVGWHLWGLAGMGAAYATQMTLFLGAVWLVYKRRLGFSLPRGVAGIFLWGTVISLAGAAGRTFVGWWVPLVMAAFCSAMCLSKSRRTDFFGRLRGR